MVKVRFETVTLRIPVIDNSGDHDAKMHVGRFEEIHHALAVIQGDALDKLIAGAPVSQTHQFLVDQQIKGAAKWAGDLGGDLYPAPPISQEDPPINTAVSDREMRSDAPDMSLEEFRERPERTRAPPRPRANSWRHKT